MSNRPVAHVVQVGNVRIGPGCPLALIAGPCVIESREHTLKLAEAINHIAHRLRMPFIFKASFDKANRSSLASFRGPGMEAGLAILSEVQASLGVPVTSDVHEPSQAEPAGKVLDLLQIPAFLCRQTDLLVAAGRTGRAVNVKKGQFISPDEMGLAVEKVRESAAGLCGAGAGETEPGDARSRGQAGGVLLTERGTFFGYGRLVNDMTSIPRMASYAPVVFDATHSCQLPGQGGAVSGGQREMVPVLARAGVGAGADALFLEVHDRPAEARSDAATVWPLDQLEWLLEACLRIADAASGPPGRS
jgi:2-dehydro-3-deoxyphosphooctonate aldolase (KDO 8-P synthase)